MSAIENFQPTFGTYIAPELVVPELYKTDLNLLGKKIEYDAAAEINRNKALDIMKVFQDSSEVFPEEQNNFNKIKEKYENDFKTILKGYDDGEYEKTDQMLRNTAQDFVKNFTSGDASLMINKNIGFNEYLGINTAAIASWGDLKEALVGQKKDEFLNAKDKDSINQSMNRKVVQKWDFTDNNFVQALSVFLKDKWFNKSQNSLKKDGIETESESGRQAYFEKGKDALEYIETWANTHFSASMDQFNSIMGTHFSSDNIAILGSDGRTITPVTETITDANGKTYTIQHPMFSDIKGIYDAEIQTSLWTNSTYKEPNPEEGNKKGEGVDPDLLSNIVATTDTKIPDEDKKISGIMGMSVTGESGVYCDPSVSAAQSIAAENFYSTNGENGEPMVTGMDYDRFRLMIDPNDLSLISEDKTKKIKYKKPILQGATHFVNEAQQIGNTDMYFYQIDDGNNYFVFQAYNPGTSEYTLYYPVWGSERNGFPNERVKDGKYKGWFRVTENRDIHESSDTMLVNPEQLYICQFTQDEIISLKMKNSNFKFNSKPFTVIKEIKSDLENTLKNGFEDFYEKKVNEFRIALQKNPEANLPSQIMTNKISLSFEDLRSIHTMNSEYHTLLSPDDFVIQEYSDVGETKVSKTNEKPEYNKITSFNFGGLGYPFSIVTTDGNEEKTWYYRLTAQNRDNYYKFCNAMKQYVSPNSSAYIFLDAPETQQIIQLDYFMQAHSKNGNHNYTIKLDKEQLQKMGFYFPLENNQYISIARQGSGSGVNTKMTLRFHNGNNVESVISDGSVSDIATAVLGISNKYIMSYDSSDLDVSGLQERAKRITNMYAGQNISTIKRSSHDLFYYSYYLATKQYPNANFITTLQNMLGVENINHFYNMYDTSTGDNTATVNDAGKAKGIYSISENVLKDYIEDGENNLQDNNLLIYKVREGIYEYAVVKKLSNGKIRIVDETGEHLLEDFKKKNGNKKYRIVRGNWFEYSSQINDDLYTPIYERK